MKKYLSAFCSFILFVSSVFAISPQDEYDSLYKDIRNVSTYGYKGSCNYETGKSDGSPILCQGSLYHTQINTDFGITSKGFFKVLDEEGNVFYSRYGSLRIDKDCRLCILCNNKKYYLPIEALQPTFDIEGLRIYRNGIIESKYYVDYKSKISKIVGTIELYDILNENIESYDGFVIKTKTEPEKIQDPNFVAGMLESSTVYINHTLLRMLFLLEKMNDNQIKQKKTKEYIIKYLLSVEFQEKYMKEALQDLSALQRLDDYTLFLERLYE